MDVRKILKSTVIVVLFGLLIISFAMFGINDVFKPVASDTVLSAGSRQLSSADFKRVFNNRREQIQQEAKRPVSVDEAVANGMDAQLLQMLLGNEALGAVVDSLGLRASGPMIAERLRETPDFFDPVSGRFDEKAYEGVLAENGLTPKVFERRVSQDVASSHFFSAIDAGFRPPLTYGAFQGVYATESRDASFIFVDPSKVAAVAPPTDAQLQAFLAENASLVRKPELRQLTFARFSTAALLPTMTADPAEVQKVFNFRKDQAAKPETRTVIQIPAKDQAAAQTISARLSKGEDPAAVAKAVGASIINYEAKPKTALPDRKVADAAFSLAAGQTSGPIQGELGFAVVKVMSITPGQSIELDQVRKEVEAEVKERAAELKITEAADKFEASHSAGADMVTAAKGAGGQIFTTGPIDARGADSAGKPAAGLSQKLMETAFKLAQGEESEFQTDTKGEYFIVRVDKIVAPALPTLDEVRPNLTKAFIARELDKRLKAKGDELAERLRKGESADAVAASIGTKANRANGVSRINAQQQAQVVGAPLIQTILAAKKGEVSIVPAPQPGLFVTKIEAIKPGDINAVARMAADSRAQIGQQLGQELGEAVIRASLKTVKTKTYPDRARSAIGAAPLTPVKTDAKADAKAAPKDKAG